MVIDKDGTKQAPAGWEIWTTGRKWQAIKKGAKTDDKNAWGPIQKTKAAALTDAANLSALPL